MPGKRDPELYTVDTLKDVAERLQKALATVDHARVEMKKRRITGMWVSNKKVRDRLYEELTRLSTALHGAIENPKRHVTKPAITDHGTE